MSGRRARRDRDDSGLAYAAPGSPEWRSRLVSYLGDLADLIARHPAKQAVQGVFGDSPGESFSYTVGRTERALPELWLGSLSPEQATPILNRLGVMDLPAPPAEVDCDYSVPFRLHGLVELEAAHVGVARQLYGFHPEAVQVVQVLWPDNGGKYPGEEGYDSERFPQVVLPLVTS